CVKQHIRAVQQPTAPLAGILLKKDVSCNGGNDGQLTVSLSGGTAPYTYQWSHGPTTRDADSIIAGNYTLVITDANACVLNLSETIAEPQSLVITSVVDPVKCFGGSDGSIDATISGGTAPYSLTWTNSVYAVLNHTNPFFGNLKTDTYRLQATDANGCITLENILVPQPTAPLGVSVAGKTDVS